MSIFCVYRTSEYPTNICPPLRFKQWWDKYRTTLKDIEAEYTAADAEMKEFLEELGYED